MALVLLFSTVAHHARAARLHSATCPMVNTSRPRDRGSVKLITDDLAEVVRELEERGFPVKRCRCCGKEAVS